MPISNHYKRVPLENIKILREQRQRREVNTKGLEDSIKKFGVLNPILIDRDFVLVAGERRLAASKALGLPDIPCRFIDELSDHERQIVELDENLRRSDLSWQDNIRAHGRIHDLFMQIDPKWTMTATSRELGYDPSSMMKICRVYKDLASPKIAEMPTFAAAYNYLMRQDERGHDRAVEIILEASRAGEIPAVSVEEAKMQALLEGLGQEDLAKVEVLTKEKEPKLKQPDAIICMDFLQWAPTYSGPKFNFIHFDPPYGVDIFTGKQSGYEALEATYNDSEEVFWELTSTLLQHRNTLMQNACHIMFWFSMDYYSKIISFFAEHAPEFTINPFPLIWHKSDGTSILPDPRRGPRRNYETAFVCSRGDRFVIKPVANLYAAPTNKTLHPSTKPEPMLRHFFQLFVDEYTFMLDPTCGSGSSIRAAESMNAEFVLGLEKDPTFAEKAGDALRQERLKAQAAKVA